MDWLKLTVLVAAQVPMVGIVVFCKVNVPLAATSTGPVKANPEGTVKFTAERPSPTTTLEDAPETVQTAPMVAAALFLISKVWPEEIKSAGEVPVPSVLVPPGSGQFEVPCTFGIIGDWCNTRS